MGMGGAERCKASCVGPEGFMTVEETRQRILAAALRLLETGGLARLATKEIARAAGCAEGTLFKHFKSKEELCLAVVRESAPRFQREIAQIRAGDRSVQKNLEEIALACIRFSEKLIPLGVALLADGALLKRHRKTGPDRGPKEAFELIAGYIAGEQRIGRIDARIRPLQVAGLIFGPCFQRVFMRQVIGKNVFPPADPEFAGELISTMMLGLSPRTSDSIGTRPRSARTGHAGKA